MNYNLNIEEFPQIVREFASYKTVIQGCSEKTVTEYLFDLRTFFRYLQTGRMQVAPLRTRLVSPRDCGAVYHEIGSMKNPPFGNVFDWTDF